MDLATPAPRVEEGTVDPAEYSSSAFVEPARPGEEANVEPAPKVEPADHPQPSVPFTAMSYLETQSKVSVETLQKQGVDFESRAAVCRGAPKKNIFKLLLPMFYDQRDFVTFSEISRYAVIRGGCCFIFLEPTDLSPLYAFSLNDLYPEIEDPEHPDKYSCTVNPVSNTNKPKSNLVTVLLRYKRNKNIAYQFTFETSKDEAVVKRFVDVVERNAKMLDKKPLRASVLSANDTAASEAEMTKKESK